VTWDYGAEGRAIPVQTGDIWRVGSHVFMCGSMFDLDLGRLPADFKPSVVYADPPWGAALLHGFYTKAGLERPPFGWLDLYRRVLAMAGGLPCFMESGWAQAPEIAPLCYGLYSCWHITYDRKAKACLHYCGPELPEGLDLTGLDDSVTPAAVLAAYPPGVVLDPCAGRGFTSRAAQQAGWVSVNVELHPARVSAAMTRLAKLTGGDAELRARLAA
jgi:hypothetical protein